jgi:hypothetical protein
MRTRTIPTLALIAAGLGACSAADQAAQGTSAALPAPTADTATRSQPVVPGRPGRVFVFAGIGKACESLPAPELTIANRPSKGDISFVAGQETAIAASAQGTCAGAKAKGTGVYYTARAGTSGTDTFAISAKLATGETTTRNFQVTIAE